jgi:hypothetical protein
MSQYLFGVIGFLTVTPLKLVYSLTLDLASHPHYVFLRRKLCQLAETTHTTTSESQHRCHEVDLGNHDHACFLEQGSCCSAGTSQYKEHLSLDL